MRAKRVDLMRNRRGYLYVYPLVLDSAPNNNLRQMSQKRQGDVNDTLGVVVYNDLGPCFRRDGAQ
jgi:hypothetical protein